MWGNLLLAMGTLFFLGGEMMGLELEQINRLGRDVLGKVVDPCTLSTGTEAGKMKSCHDNCNGKSEGKYTGGCCLPKGTYGHSQPLTTLLSQVVDTVSSELCYCCESGYQCGETGCKCEAKACQAYCVQESEGEISSGCCNADKTECNCCGGEQYCTTANRLISLPHYWLGNSSHLEKDDPPGICKDECGDDCTDNCNQCSPDRKQCIVDKCEDGSTCDGHGVCKTDCDYNKCNKMCADSGEGVGCCDENNNCDCCLSSETCENQRCEADQDTCTDGSCGEPCPDGNCAPDEGGSDPGKLAAAGVGNEASPILRGMGKAIRRNLG